MVTKKTKLGNQKLEKGVRYRLLGKIFNKNPGLLFDAESLAFRSLSQRKPKSGFFYALDHFNSYPSKKMIIFCKYANTLNPMLLGQNYLRERKNGVGAAPGLENMEI